MLEAPAPVILVCGSRGFRNRALVSEVVETFDPKTVVIAGGANGPDKWAEIAADRRGLHVAVVRPIWHRYGKRAGPERNEAMMRLRPSYVVAFWDGKSSGTANTIELAGASSVPAVIYREDGSSRLRLPESVADARRRF